MNTQVWEAQRERSTPRTMRLALGLALHLGRRSMRLLLLPIVLYFLMTGGAPARASRDFLHHALGREPRLRERLRHWYSFAAVLLDRIYLLGTRGDDFDVVIENEQAMLDIAREGRGALLLVAHFGSFDVMRVIGRRQRQLPIHIVVDRQHGAMFTQLLEALDPELAAGVIDASERGPALALVLKQALDQGHLLGLMADRAHAGQRTVEVQFMKRPAPLPESPWILAGVLKVPVILAFGIYEGGNRYRIRFELLARQVLLPRSERSAAVQGYAQAYADRLAAQVQAAPCNWFNFYDFWTDEKSAD
jgi:predicted LPLAT superfamily acyltransferase